VLIDHEHPDLRKPAAPLAMHAIALAFVALGTRGLVFDVVMWVRGVHQTSQIGLILADDALFVWLIRIGVGVFRRRHYVLAELPWMLYLLVFLGGYLGAPGLSDTRRPGLSEYAIAYSTLGVIAYGLYRYFQRPNVRSFFENAADGEATGTAGDDDSLSETATQGGFGNGTTGEPEDAGLDDDGNGEPSCATDEHDDDAPSSDQR
jgi:hypothetical protein